MNNIAVVIIILYALAVNKIARHCRCERRLRSPKTDCESVADVAMKRLLTLRWNRCWAELHHHECCDERCDEPYHHRYSQSMYLRCSTFSYTDKSSPLCKASCCDERCMIPMLQLLQWFWTLRWACRFSRRADAAMAMMTNNFEEDFSRRMSF